MRAIAIVQLARCRRNKTSPGHAHRRSGRTWKRLHRPSSRPEPRPNGSGRWLLRLGVMGDTGGLGPSSVNPGKARAVPRRRRPELGHREIRRRDGAVATGRRASREPHRAGRPRAPPRVPACTDDVGRAGSGQPCSLGVITCSRSQEARRSRRVPGATGAGSDGRFEDRLVGIVRHGVGVGAGSEEPFGRPPLASVTGLPEGCVELVGRRRGTLLPTAHRGG
jgi:hypothetical protein